MRRNISPLLIGLFLPSLAYAHESGHGGGFMDGLSHPVFGLDHFLAMISVGILSAQMGGRARWIAPTTFLSAMLVGGILGMDDVEVPLFSVEHGIAFSVLALGVVVAAPKKLPLTLTLVLIGFFALFHGHAHGDEMPESAKAALYACGFLSGAAGLHLAGLLVGILAGGFSQGAQLLRYAGAGIAGIGFHILYTM